MPSNKLVQSVTRALMILELLAGAEDGLSLQQISNDLDLKSPTAHNLLRTLMARGYVERLSEPIRYCLGATMVDLVDQYRNRLVERFAAQAVSEISARFDNVRTTYCEEINGEVVLKLRMTPDRPGLLERPWRAVMLPYTSASVLVFQAFWREDQRQSYNLRYPFEVYGAHIWETAEKAQAFLAEVREKGYADPPVTQSGLFRVAVPVFSTGNNLVGVLGAAFNTGDVEGAEAMKTTLIQSLKETAAQFRTMET